MPCILPSVFLIGLLGAAAVLPAAVAQGDWYSGRATFYGEDGWSIHEGSCLFGTIDANEGTGWDVAALADMNADFPGSCGRCYEVACQPMDFKDGYGEWLQRSDSCHDSSVSVVVRVTDACQCQYAANSYSNRRWCCGDMYHMDLSVWAFRKLAPETLGVIGIRFRWVPCDYTPSNQAGRKLTEQNTSLSGMSHV